MGVRVAVLRDLNRILSGRTHGETSQDHSVVGHSFGADVLFGSIAGALNAELGASSVSATLSAAPFADLTVLVNPAFEASLYRRFAMTAKEHFVNGQLPILVTVQSTNDAVTHYVLPVERAIVSVPETTSTLKDYRASIAAMGHYSDYFTHTLAQRPPPIGTRGADTQTTVLIRALTSQSAKVECGCERLTASSTTRAAMVESVLASLEASAPDDHPLAIGDPMVGLISELKPMSGVDPKSPFMLVRATPEVVDGHSGIYRGQFFDFLANLIVRVQLIENEAARRELPGMLRRIPRVPQ
jgi:hypothetical protein